MVKPIDFYGMAEEVAEHGWWEEYADVPTCDYLEFIGLEVEAPSSAQ